MKSLFDRKYRNWQSYCTRLHVSEQSSDNAYIENRPFEEIVSLGEPVIPYIISRLKDDSEAHFLVHALERITGKKFSSDELADGMAKYGSPLGNQGLARMWVDWWESQSWKN